MQGHHLSQLFWFQPCFRLIPCHGSCRPSDSRWSPLIFKLSSGTQSILSPFIYLSFSIHLVSKDIEICLSVSGRTVHSQGSLHFTCSQEEETLCLYLLDQKSGTVSPHPSISRTPTSASPNSFFECLSCDVTCNIGIRSCLSCLQGLERIVNTLKSLQ